MRSIGRDGVDARDNLKHNPFPTANMPEGGLVRAEALRDTQCQIAKPRNRGARAKSGPSPRYSEMFDMFKG